MLDLDALPRYNNIQMLFHQDKIEDKLFKFKKDIKVNKPIDREKATLDDDNDTFAAA